MKLEQKTIDALRWITDILHRHNVPYRIGGGFAAHVYGSPRKVNDIDISLPGNYFDNIMPEISEYITYNLGHSANAKWDCIGLTLEYKGQEIDMTDVDTLRMSSLDFSKWFQTKDEFRKFDPILTDVSGIKVYLIDPRDLFAYKKELADINHLYQLEDINAVETYIKENNK